jgi:hypothetical protein
MLKLYRSLKWWKRILFHLVDLALVNANILYNMTNEKKLTHMSFRVQVAQSLLQNHHPIIRNRFHAPTMEMPMRLTERPMPEIIAKESPYGGCHQCVVCSAKGKRSQTRYRCKTCKAPLHIDTKRCFEIYHTQLDYTK